mgnify:CR=1 FL=1
MVASGFHNGQHAINQCLVHLELGQRRHGIFRRLHYCALGDFQLEQREPVLDPRKIDEAAVPGDKAYKSLVGQLNGRLYVPG